MKTFRMFPVRQILASTARVLPTVRAMSSKGPFVDLAFDDDGIATLTLQRPPVNSLNLELLQEISKSLDEVSKNKARAMILTSSSPTVFSAGLDITELHRPDPKRVETFWSTLQEVWIKLYGSGFITAAAINGHSPAGGCLLATSCEYRSMVSGKYTIGLNETALGIVAPVWFMDSMLNTVPRREAELALTTAKLFTVDEAVKIGLVDDAAKDKEDAIAKCKEFFARFDNVDPVARAVTKQQIRADAIQRLVKDRKADVNQFLSFVNNPKVQQRLDMYMQMLKKKSGK